MTDLLTSENTTAFVEWMLDQVVVDARGDDMQTLTVKPDGRLWLGRLAPEMVVQNSRLGDRSERLEPCEVGIRVRPSTLDGRSMRCTGRLVAWEEFDGGPGPDDPKWRKSESVEVVATLQAPTAVGGTTVAGNAEFAAALSAVGASGIACEFHAEIELGKDGPELVVTLVNVAGRTHRVGHQRLPGEPRGRRRSDRALPTGQPARLVPVRSLRRGLRGQRWHRPPVGDCLPHHRCRRERPASSGVLGPGCRTGSGHDVHDARGRPAAAPA
jgi:hypothetical protein